MDYKDTDAARLKEIAFSDVSKQQQNQQQKQ